MSEIRLFGVERNSTVDGPGIRFAIFTQGCKHHCKGCHNPDSWPMDGGYCDYIDQLVDQVISDPLVTGITFSGGDPFYQANECVAFLEELWHRTSKKYHVATYTGYVFEELVMHQKYWQFLSKIDVIVDGPYIEELRDLRLRWKGSRNQRIIDVQQSLQEGHVVLSTDKNWI